MLLVTHHVITTIAFISPLFIWPLSLIEVGLVGVRGSLAGNYLLEKDVPKDAA